MKRLCVALVAIASFAIGVQAQDQFTVIAPGLQSPRGLTFAPGGRLYAAVAGSGGNTGKIIEIRNPWNASPPIREVVTGLISTGGNGEFVGVDGISAEGNGNIKAIMAESIAATGLSGTQIGHLLKVNTAGEVKTLADVGDFDYAWSSQRINLAPHDFPDANPYGVLAQPGATYVADAGTNTLDLVRPNGTIKVLAYFPNNVIADSTPTCIAKGPDGALYVGTLALVDSLVFGHKAVVYRVDLSQTDPNSESKILSVAKPWATGLWPINGCAFGPDGTFYASQLITNQQFSGGDVVKIAFAHPDQPPVSLTGATLTFPAGVAVGPDRAVYVSNGSAEVPFGEIVRLNNR